MTKTDTTIEHENVNGFKLVLKVDKKKNTPNSRHFTISYKNEGKSSSWPKISLFLAVMFNLIALTYVRISVTALLVIIVVFSVILIFWVTHSVQSESLVVIPTVGIQSSVQYVCGREDTFLPWASIDDVVINEVIKMNRVLYYLTVLVKQIHSPTNTEAIKLIPMFKFTKPRLLMLERIYSELQTLLADNKNKGDQDSGDKG